MAGKVNGPVLRLIQIATSCQMELTEGVVMKGRTGEVMLDFLSCNTKEVNDFMIDQQRRREMRNLANR